MQVNSLEVFVDNMLVEPKLSLGYIKSILAMQDELLTLAKDEDLTIETQLQSTMHARLVSLDQFDVFSETEPSFPLSSGKVSSC